MIGPETLIQFVQKERNAEAEDERFRDLLSRDTLIERGVAVGGLSVIRKEKAEVWLKCPANESRLRPGSRLILEAVGKRLTANLIDLQDSGLTFHLRLSKDQASLPVGPWFATEAGIDLSPLLIQSLKKLQPGAPGWSFFRAIAGDASAKEYPSKVADQADRDAVVGRVLQDASTPIDQSQREAILACVGQPSMLAVQGPPGTGKTLVLALVAESLARLGRRVLLTAPTHQAVNNALATIHRAFPARPVVKVGDELRRESLPDDIDCMLLRDGGPVDAAQPGRRPDHRDDVPVGAPTLGVADRAGSPPTWCSSTRPGNCRWPRGLCRPAGGRVGPAVRRRRPDAPGVRLRPGRRPVCDLPVPATPGGTPRIDPHAGHDSTGSTTSSAGSSRGVLRGTGAPLRPGESAAGRRFRLPKGHGEPAGSLAGIGPRLPVLVRLDQDEGRPRPAVEPRRGPVHRLAGDGCVAGRAAIGSGRRGHPLPPAIGPDPVHDPGGAGRTRGHRSPSSIPSNGSRD